MVREAVADVGEFLDIGNADVSVRGIEEEDWANSWKKHFKPLRISLRTMICPSWETCDTQDGVELIVKLDPGSALYRYNATTAKCELLDNELASRETNRTVLDLGAVREIICDCCRLELRR
jgi:ribosomal protein L11 methyltransferase